MELNAKELEIISKVKENMMEDDRKGPFRSDKWYKGFTKDNENGYSLSEAPVNVPLMVVTESVGTLYKYDRGQAIMRGSVLLKVSDNEVLCLDSKSWYAGSLGASVFENNGTFTFGSGMIYGKVKEVMNVNV